MSLNLIIVEDDEQDYQMFNRTLKKFDFPFELKWLKDGLEAQKYIENFNLTIPQKTLFFLDINLPMINGLELVKKIKDNPSIRASIVVMLSSSDQKNDIETAKQNGADYYMIKPCGRDEIIEFKNKLNSIFKNLV